MWTCGTHIHESLTSLNSQMRLGGLTSSSRGQCLIPMEVCPSSTSAHSSVTELKRISFWDVYSKYWREKETVIWPFFLHLQLKCISLTQACIHTFLWKEAETKRLKLFLLLSSATSVFCLESQLVQFWYFFSYPLGLQDVLLCCCATAINALYDASASVSRDLMSKDGALALSIKQTWAQTRLFPSGVISTTWSSGTKDAMLPVLPVKRRVR